VTPSPDQNVVEQLQTWVDRCECYAGDDLRALLPALLAVVEAAQKLKHYHEAQEADETVGGSIGLAMSKRTAWDQLCDALARLNASTEAGD